MQIHTIKTAQIQGQETPDADTIATYVETLKVYLKDHPNMNATNADLIKNLPDPGVIQRDFSNEQARILTETVGHLWRDIVGQDIVEENKIEHPPETLDGTYWLINNGVLLHGINHYDIIKRYFNMFTSLLDVGAFTLQQYMLSDREQLMGFIIRNGGVRMFVDKHNDAFFQMTPETYGAWGRHKVAKYGFDNNVVRVINTSYPYKGWDSGIVVKL